jgi:hypothetical protein
MKLSDKIKFALDEGRMLILGGQVLIGFGYQSVFQPRFEKLPVASQHLLLASHLLMLIGLVLTMSPAARDSLVERCEPTERFLRFATLMIGWGLMPFAIGLGVATYLAVRIVEGGEATERQHRITTAFLLAAMVTLPSAITGDLFVVVRKVMLSPAIAAGISIAMLSLFYLIWFGLGLAIRVRDKGLAG